MTQGLYIDGNRPKSKKAVREALADDMWRVAIEATSWHGNEFGGDAGSLPVGAKIVFVGPCPHTDRRFYGTLVRTATGFKVT